MDILEYLNQSRMVIDLQATTKDEAINELSQVLKEDEQITDYDLFVADVFERENVKSTAIGHGIAIPHARTDAVKDFVIVFGRSVNGIETDSVDNGPVKLFFLMGTPKHQGINDYLKFLAYLTRILDKEDFRKQLLESSNADDVIEKFKNIACKK